MTLLELQRRMEEDVRRPLTADFEMRKTSDDGSSVGVIAASYISPNDRLSSFERLEIYNRQYWFRLISAVSEDYPTPRYRAWAPALRSADPCLSQRESFHVLDAPRCRC